MDNLSPRAEADPVSQSEERRTHTDGVKAVTSWTCAYVKA